MKEALVASSILALIVGGAVAVKPSSASAPGAGGPAGSSKAVERFLAAEEELMADLAAYVRAEPIPADVVPAADAKEEEKRSAEAANARNAQARKARDARLKQIERHLGDVRRNPNAIQLAAEWKLFLDPLMEAYARDEKLSEEQRAARTARCVQQLEDLAALR